MAIGDIFAIEKYLRAQQIAAENDMTVAVWFGCDSYVFVRDNKEHYTILASSSDMDYILEYLEPFSWSGVF